jgi:hypothetical protein
LSILPDILARTNPKEETVVLQARRNKRKKNRVGCNITEA